MVASKQFICNLNVENPSFQKFSKQKKIYNCLIDTSQIYFDYLFEITEANKVKENEFKQSEQGGEPA